MLTKPVLVKNLGSRMDQARALYDIGDYRECALLAGVVRSESSDLETTLSAGILEAVALGEQGEYRNALDVLTEVGGLIDKAPARLKAKYFGQRAYMKGKIGEADSLLIDYEAARTHAIEAGDAVTIATVRNNLAKQYSNAGRLNEAVAESDAAISVARVLCDDVYLGRALDMRAQILVDNGLYEDALEYSEQAIRLLENHPSLKEAQTTHGHALIGLGSALLGEPDSIECFYIRRKLIKAVPNKLLSEVARDALEQANGRVSKAAEILKISHPSMIDAIDRFQLDRASKRRRNKTLITK